MANSSETWDFFICYMQATADDFAKALKKFLEKCGKHSFLDTEDIPAKFRGTEKWADAIDQAVIECKTFILIMTAEFNTSEQIKREVTLARIVPNKLFVYFRHEDLKPYLKLTLERETIDLGQQQQHVFSTASDLARKAHKVLVDEQDNASPKPSTNLSLRTPPIIIVTQSSAFVGAKVRLLGGCFNPNSVLSLYFGGIKLPLDNSLTNNAGSYAGYFTVPNFVPGTYTLALSDSGNSIAATAITITVP